MASPTPLRARARFAAVAGAMCAIMAAGPGTLIVPAAVRLTGPVACARDERIDYRRVRYSHHRPGESSLEVACFDRGERGRARCHVPGHGHAVRNLLRRALHGDPAAYDHPRPTRHPRRAIAYLTPTTLPVSPLGGASRPPPARVLPDLRKHEYRSDTLIGADTAWRRRRMATAFTIQFVPPNR